MKKFTKRNLFFITGMVMASGVTLAQAPAPYGAIPTARQIKWQETEMYCIVHFTPTTFQNKEWGYGDADPSIFNPTKFDANQIVAAAKLGGFKGIVYVAKHHDGFALWPTKTSKYNISESPWKNGKGDMVREFQMAARKEGLKFGIYCSPWDRNNNTYGTPEYVNVYRNQLRELYSNYGDLFMSWHDGANGGDGYYGGKNEKRNVDQSQYYDWVNTWQITRKMQPDAAIFSDIGLDVRWVGNEIGKAPETSWSTISLQGKGEKSPMPGFMDDANLGSGTREGKQWIPFEGDVALRPGWFYHPEQDDQLKSTAELFNIYCSSVGRGGALDLGLSPTTEGILHANDVAALAAFGKYLKSVFAVNLAKSATITVSNIRGKQPAYGTKNLIDNDRYSYWATDDKVRQATLGMNFKKPVTFTLLQLRENIKLGQRIDSVHVEAFVNNKWQKIGSATSIGANRIIQFGKNITASKVQVKIFAPVSITLSEVGLFLEPKLESSAGKKNKASYNKASWKVINNASSITIDMGTQMAVSAIGYLPEQEKSSAGAIQKYELSVSEDGKSWTLVSSGEFSNIAANPIEQTIALKHPAVTRFVKLESKQAVPGNNGKVQLDISQIEVFR